MSTAATTRPVSAATAARRATSVRGSTSSPTPTSTPLVSKGATARSAVNPRATAVSTGPQRKTSLRIVPNNTLPPGTENEALLTASLKRETDQKEDLLVQVQNKDSTITTLTKENDQLTSALSAAETRLAELYRDQARMEEELASRHEVTDKLRVQLKDFEKEKRDIQRRYNEQTATFEAERQAFYDNEQHLKSRIQSLTQTRKAAPPPRLAPDNVSIVSEREYPAEEEPRTPRTAKSMADQQMTPMAISEPPEATESETEQADTEPAEMTALRLELSTLSTSHTSLQTTLQLLQNQLLDLKRVNATLQEENESYNILLREKTLTGQFDIMRQVGRSPSPDDDDGSKADSQSLRSTGRSSTLDRLPEIEEHEEEGQEQPKSLGDELGNALSPPSRDQSPSRNSTRGQRRNKRAQSPATKGESLGDLPITGPGLDLAAELGRAENKDILEGRVDPANIKSPTTTRGRKKSTARKDDKDDVPGEVEALKIEVKSLKDANKALSLYASKIIDRIIAHEGFEQVLSVDFVPKTPAVTKEFEAPPTNNFLEPNRPDRRARAQSAIFQSRPQSGMFLRPAAEPLTTFDSFPPPRTPTVPEPPKDTRRSRRSLSFDWKGGFSLFGGGNKDNAANNPNLRPLTLQAGSIANARKLETTEDDNDRKERERLNATMKLMGIDPKDESAAMGQSASAPAPPPKTSPPLPPKETALSAPATPGLEAPPRRPFSWFRKSPADSTASSVNNDEKPAMLTTEALEQAEAVSQIAALDARELVLRKEISEGKPSGYTEMAPRPSLGDEWRSRRSSRKSSGRPKSGGSGSGSTVWSAGMSKAEEEEAEADADAEVEKEVAAAIV